MCVVENTIEMLVESIRVNFDVYVSYLHFLASLELASPSPSEVNATVSAHLGGGTPFTRQSTYCIVISVEVL